MDLNELRWVGLVAIGGAVGSVARYLVAGALTRGSFPWGTFAVNFAGTFLLCLLFFAFLQGGHIPTDVRTLLFIGVFGGFTTFATFGLETVTLFSEGQWGLASANVLLNAGVCLGGAFLGRVAGLFLGGA